ncbi:DgyrCDS6456 [Dimorphilus gyrociliatus]|uniref:DgyrCDS6456 n=1 Tax=Dimorphilus gyrociliatus TaxID=2664684 RepID=A0A7I8VPQ5_9ANNE|nr:DgyrCDS6456 [Dimorphilus gyrociliatus]
MGPLPFKNLTSNETSPVDYDDALLREVLDRLVTPVLCSLGVIGNLLNLYALSVVHFYKSLNGVRHKETATHFGLVTLSISDIFFCLFLIPRSFTNTKASMFSDCDNTFSGYYQMYSTALISTCLTSSTWITVAMALLRYAAICHPFSAVTFSGRSASKIAYGVVLLSSIIFCLPLFWEYKTHVIPSTKDNCKDYILDVGYMNYSKTPGQIYLWIKVVVATFIPAILLAFSNLALIRALRRSYRMRRLCHVRSDTTTVSSRVTLTLIVIVVAFIVLVFPTELMDFFVHILVNNETTEQFLIARSVANLLQVFNFSSNFLLYCALNPMFRSVICDLVRCRKLSRTRQAMPNEDVRNVSSRFTNVTATAVGRKKSFTTANHPNEHTKFLDTYASNYPMETLDRSSECYN